jgi:LacI family transcriptional regulator
MQQIQSYLGEMSGWLSARRLAVEMVATVPLLTDDSQIGANLQVCPDEENRADWDQRG